MNKKIIIAIVLVIFLITSGIFVSAAIQKDKNVQEESLPICGSVNGRQQCSANTCNGQCGGNCGESNCGCGK